MQKAIEELQRLINSTKLRVTAFNLEIERLQDMGIHDHIAIEKRNKLNENLERLEKLKSHWSSET